MGRGGLWYLTAAVEKEQRLRLFSSRWCKRCCTRVWCKGGWKAGQSSEMMYEDRIKGEKSCCAVTRTPSASSKKLREDLVSLRLRVDRSWTVGIQRGWWWYTSACVETRAYILSGRDSSMRANFPKSMMTLYFLAIFTSGLSTFLFF